MQGQRSLPLGGPRHHRPARTLAVLILAAGWGVSETASAQAPARATPVRLVRVGGGGAALPDSTTPPVDPGAGVAPGVHTGTIQGTVRSSSSGDALPGASIELGTVHVATRTDANGAYLVRGVPPGSSDLRVTLDGYDPLTIEVSVPPSGTVRVDVTLTHQQAPVMPVHIAEPVHVTAVRPPAMPAANTTVDEWGTWHWSGDMAHSALPTGEPDIFRMLAENPTVAVRPEGPPVVMSQGGGGDATLVLLDGFPLWSPVHAGGALSAVTPDAVGGVTLHDGAMPARYGGRLASVLDIETRDLRGGAPTVGAAVGPAASRLVWGDAGLHGGTQGSALIALRRSNAGFLTHRGDMQSLIDRWNDGVGVLSLSHGAAAVRVVALASSDGLGGHSGSSAFDTSAAAPAGVSHAGGSSGAGGSGTGTTWVTLPDSPVRWSTHTVGVVWTQQVAAHGRLETRLWQAGFDSHVRQGTDSNTFTLANTVRHVGVTSQITWGETTVGTSLERVGARYAVTDVPYATYSSTPRASGEQDSSYRSDPPLHLQATPTLVTAFVERRWQPPSGRWLAQTGLRATGLSGAPLSLEPRAVLALHVTPEVTATVGYARVHQFIQSLRNPGAPLGALVGIDLPVAAGANGVPVGRSDVATGGVTASLGQHTTLALNGYVRRMAGLATADPTSATFFANWKFQIATGHAAGAGATLMGETGRLSWRTSYGVGRTIYTTAYTSYHPASELGRTASASLSVQLDRLTRLHVTGWSATGQQAVRLDQSGAQESYGTSEGEYYSRGNLQGLAQSTAQQMHLPPYLRFDLGASHDWPTGPGRGALSAFLTLANLLDRSNIAAYVPAQGGGAPRPIPLSPRTLLAGAAWWY